MARDPRRSASDVLLGFAGGATVLAAAVSTTTGHQGPFAVAGLAGLAAGEWVPIPAALSDGLAFDHAQIINAALAVKEN